MKQVFIKIKQNHYVNLDLDDIMYIKAKGDYCSIYVNNDKFSFIVRSTMKNMENKLLEYGFYRIHNSTIVNSRYIKSIEDDCVYLNHTLYIHPPPYHLHLTISKDYFKLLIHSKLFII